MNISIHRHRPWPLLVQRDEQHVGWLSDAILSGFVATFAMTASLAAGFGGGRAIGDREGRLVSRWFWSLTHAPMTRTSPDTWAWVIACHLLMGMAWAVLYARAVEPALATAGWRTGTLFATIPWALSVVVFLPVVGGGLFGRRIDAGPLPVLGNLILHLVYGGILGAVYAVAREEEHDETVNRTAMAGAERGAAIWHPRRLDPPFAHPPQRPRDRPGRDRSEHALRADGRGEVGRRRRDGECPDRMVRRFAELHALIASLLTRDLTSRLATTLLRLAQAIGRPEANGLVHLAQPLSRQILAEMVGTTGGTLARPLQELERCGAVRWIGSKHFVVDRAKLTILAQRHLL